MNDYYELNKIKNILTLSEDDQKRIKYLKIPPNWTSVKISKDSSSKIQVTGIDSKNRTQYIYHPAWVQFSKETKYSNINAFDFKKLNNILKKYCNFEGSYTKNYIISNMIILMKDLNIRVGNEKYLEENDSVGLCTLSKKHYKNIKENDKNIHKLSFKGKKGVYHEKILNNNHVIFIDNVISLPGTLLFKYIDKDSSKNYKKIIPDDLNQFLKDYVDKDMTCKDIRTYCANQIFKKEYSRLLRSGISEKKSRIEATKLTAIELGNTPKVCRDSYIDPSNY